MTPELLDIQTVAQVLKLHPMTVYKLARDGRLPMAKIGGQWRIYRDSLERWVRDQEAARVQ